MIRKTSCMLVIVLAGGLNALAFAEETGTGKPQNSTTQQTAATTTDCSWIDTMLGRCETSEDTSVESQ